MNYSDMTDFFINKAVAATLLEEWYDNGKCVIKCDDDDRSIFNPCNSWADAGPIIQSSRLYVDPIFISDWCVTTECDTYREIHKNPLRAAMIVFLMMQEPK